MNETTLSDVLRWTWRVWVGTWKAQLVIAVMYIALLALCGGSLLLGSIGIVGMVLGIPLLFLFPALPFVIGGLIAPDAGEVLRGQPAAFDVPWRRAPSIMVWSFGLLFIFWFLGQFCLIPGYIALAALWPWTMVLACEPGAPAVARAQELSVGFRLRFCWWHLVVSAISGGPAILVALMFIGGAAGDDLPEPMNTLLALLALTVAPLAIFLSMSFQGAFLAALYHMTRREREVAEVDDLLTIFE